MISIERYTPSDAARWDEFARDSSNATFLHLRGYMDYHSDRFSDCSLMAFDKKGRLVAMLAANIDGTTLYSHQGLTYGGWITARCHFDTQTMLDVWDAAIAWMKDHGITDLVYKAIPHIYQRYPADDDIYALYRHGATIEWCQISSALPLESEWLPNKENRRMMRLAQKSGITISRSTDFEGYMKILSRRLEERYGTTPVHSLEEMLLLASRFPENIRLITATDGECNPLAGTILYITDTTVHTQYIATTDRARSDGLFPAIVEYVIAHECEGRQWLDFGTSCEDHGMTLNAGLNYQKYSLGGRPLAYTAYHLTL